MSIRRTLRQNASKIVLLERHVRKKQMVIHDDQVRVFRTLVHRGNEALIELRALLAGAGISPRIQPRPQIGIIRQKRQLRAVPGLRQLRPLADLPERIDLLQPLQHRLVGHLMRLNPAQKIRPPLHHRRLRAGPKARGLGSSMDPARALRCPCPWADLYDERSSCIHPCDSPGARMISREASRKLSRNHCRRQLKNRCAWSAAIDRTEQMPYSAFIK